MTLTPGTRLARYEILGPLDAGGMGQVYRARDVRLDREVAIKVLHDEHAGDPAWLSRFEREARLLAALDHDNIATVHGLDEADGTHYLVMELVPGQTLARKLAAGPLPLGEVLETGRQIAEALEVAHEAGIIHRDLKPANVMLTPEGKVKVLDFGLARSTRPAPAPSAATIVHDNQTREGAIIGTAAYMAPEQARGQVVDRRCDVWAFGCVLFEMLTGRQAFAGDTFSDILVSVIDRTPDWKALPAGLPVRIVELVHRCLHKDARRRLRDMGDGRLEIEEALHELAQGPPPVPRPPRRRPWLAVALAALVFAAGIGVGVWAPPRATPAPSLPPADDWSGEFLLGGATRAFGPRLSPDNRWLAFTVLQDRRAEVGVMNLDSGQWWALTRGGHNGGVNGLCWSSDSNRLFFDRFLDMPVGVFAVSLLDRSPGGAREQLIVPRAESPQQLCDGSLLVCKIDDEGKYRLHRHWPVSEDRPDEEVSPPIEFDMGWPAPVRALRTRNQVVFCGKVFDGRESPPKRRFYLLDLDDPRKKYRRLAGEEVSSNFVQLAVSPDDRFACTILPAGDLFRVVRLGLDGDDPPQTVLTLTTASFGLDVDSKGRLYIDQFQRGLEVLRFDATGGLPTRVASPLRGRKSQPVELSDGRVLLPSKVAGRDQLLLGVAGKEVTPLLEDRSETAPPAARIDDHHLAFVAGPPNNRRLKIATLEDDRVSKVRTVRGVPGTALTGLAASPGGETLYYISDRKLWAVPTDGRRPPRKLEEAVDGVAVYPKTGDLLIQRFDKAGVRLYRRSRRGGPLEEVKVPPGAVRLAPEMIGGRAIDEAGRILVTVTARDSWFWRVGLLDPSNGKLETIPVDFDGEIYPSNWARDGKVLGMGAPLKGELWRLTPKEGALPFLHRPR